MKCIACLGDAYNEEKFCQLFSGISDERIRKLILAFLRKDKELVFQLLFSIWNSGISYEDFLTDMSRCSKNMGYLPPQQDQKLHEIMIQGWIYYTHGRTHLLDILSLFKGVFIEVE
jgi:DNA polymerase III gamma/tau subunit